MKFLGSILGIILALGLLAALAIGGYFLVIWTYELFSGLDQEVRAVAVVVLVGTLIVAIAIRRAGEMHGLRRMGLEKKAEQYGRLIAVLQEAGGSEAGEVGADPKAAEQQLVLWASSGVLKHLAAYRSLTAHADARDPAVRSALERLLREMRRELGRNNMWLGEGDLVDLLYGQVDGDPEGGRWGQF